MNTVPDWLRTNLGRRDNLVTRPTQTLATLWSDIRLGTLAISPVRGPPPIEKPTTAARNKTLL
jgi:hypothetical protein